MKSQAPKESNESGMESLFRRERLRQSEPQLADRVRVASTEKKTKNERPGFVLQGLPGLPVLRYGERIDC